MNDRIDMTGPADWYERGAKALDPWHEHAEHNAADEAEDRRLAALLAEHYANTIGGAA